MGNCYNQEDSGNLNLQRCKIDIFLIFFKLKKMLKIN